MPRRLGLLACLLCSVSLLQAQGAESTETINASPLCVTLTKAILAAPEDFASLRGDEITSMLGSTTWVANLLLPGAASGSVLLDEPNQTSGWSSTLLQTKELAVATSAHERLAGLVTDCKIPGLVGPRSYPRDDNFGLTVWLMPQPDIAVEVRDTLFGDLRSVTLHVGHGVIAANKRKAAQR